VLSPLPPSPSPVGIHSGDTAPTPTGFAEIVGDDFPVIHSITSIFHDGVDFPGRRAPRMMKSVVAEVLDCRAYVGASVVVVVP